MKRCFIRLVPNYYSIHQKFVRSKGILSQIENIAALTTVTDTSNQDQNKQKLKERLSFVLDELDKKSDVGPVSTYFALLQESSSIDQQSKVLLYQRILRRIVQYGVMLDVQGYATLMRELCVASFENVLEILQEMQKHGLIPTKEIVALSIKSALANSRFIDAALLVKMSVDKDVVPIKTVIKLCDFGINLEQKGERKRGCRNVGPLWKHHMKVADTTIGNLRDATLMLEDILMNKAKAQDFIKSIAVDKDGKIIQVSFKNMPSIFGMKRDDGQDSGHSDDSSDSDDDYDDDDDYDSHGESDSDSNEGNYNQDYSNQSGYSEFSSDTKQRTDKIMDKVQDILGLELGLLNDSDDEEDTDDFLPISVSSGRNRRKVPIEKKQPHVVSWTNGWRRGIMLLEDFESDADSDDDFDADSTDSDSAFDDDFRKDLVERENKESNSINLRESRRTKSLDDSRKSDLELLPTEYAAIEDRDFISLRKKLLTLRDRESFNELLEQDLDKKKGIKVRDLLHPKIIETVSRALVESSKSQRFEQESDEKRINSVIDIPQDNDQSNSIEKSVWESTNESIARHSIEDMFDVDWDSIKYDFVDISSNFSLKSDENESDKIHSSVESDYEGGYQVNKISLNDPMLNYKTKSRNRDFQDSLKALEWCHLDVCPWNIPVRWSNIALNRRKNQFKLKFDQSKHTRKRNGKTKAQRKAKPKQDKAKSTQSVSIPSTMQSKASMSRLALPRRHYLNTTPYALSQYPLQLEKFKPKANTYIKYNQIGRNRSRLEDSFVFSKCLVTSRSRHHHSTRVVRYMPWISSNVGIADVVPLFVVPQSQAVRKEDQNQSSVNEIECLKSLSVLQTVSTKYAPHGTMVDVDDIEKDAVSPLRVKLYLQFMGIPVSVTRNDPEILQHSIPFLQARVNFLMKTCSVKDISKVLKKDPGILTASLDDLHDKFRFLVIFLHSRDVEQDLLDFPQYFACSLYRRLWPRLKFLRLQIGNDAFFDLIKSDGRANALQQVFASTDEDFAMHTVYCKHVSEYWSFLREFLSQASQGEMPNFDVDDMSDIEDFMS